MNPRFPLLFLLPLLVVSSFAHPHPIPEDIQSQLKAIPAYTPGDSADPLKKVEAYTFKLAPDAPQRAALEDALCDALEQASTLHAKIFLGRMLRVAGTERCIPVAEKLLTDPDGNHAARMILSSIPSPAAAEALHRQLKAATGDSQIGIIQTLGDLRHAPALEDLAELVAAPGDKPFPAAIQAIGQIGGDKALEILVGTLLDVPKDMLPTVHHAVVRAAEHADGPNAKEAYRWAFEQQQETLKLAGLSGLVRVDPENGGTLLAEAVKSENRLLAATAVSLLAESGDERTAKQFADMLADLPVATQTPVIRALAAAGDPAAADAVMERLANGDEAVRPAALEAMASLGAGRHVPALLDLAVGGQREARTALLRMDGEGVEAAIATAISGDKPKPAIEAIRAAAGRGLNENADTLITLTTHEDKRLRLEAIRALGKLAGPEQRAALVERCQTADDKEVTGFVRAIEGLHQRDPDDAALSALIDKAMVTNPCPGLVRLRLVAPTDANLAKVTKTLAIDDLRDASVRTLAEWPSQEAIPPLIDIASKDENAVHRALALRGYLRLAADADDSEALYRQAMAFAGNDADRKAVLGGLASASSPEALSVVTPLIEDEAVRDEAALAAIDIAKRLQNSQKAKVRETMALVKNTVTNEGIRNQAQDVLNELDKYQGYILLWETSGLHRIKGKDSRAVWDAAFPPEKGDKDVTWKRLTKGFNETGCSLGSEFGNVEHAATYVRVNIVAERAGPARLELGSDDAAKAWINGKEVFAWYGSRGLSPGQNTLNVELKKGTNPLLLKIVNHGGGWGFAARLRAPDGAELPGLAFDLK